MTRKDPRRRRLCCSAILTTALVACNQSDNPGGKGLVLNRSMTDRPVLFLYQAPANPIPGQPMISGVIAAIWPDGKVIRIVNRESVGQRYIVGYLSAEKLEKTLTEIERLVNKYSAQGPSVTVDAASEELALHSTQGLIYMGHTLSEKTNALFDPLRALLLSLPLEKLRPLDERYELVPGEWRKSG